MLPLALAWCAAALFVSGAGAQPQSKPSTDQPPAQPQNANERQSPYEGRLISSVRVEGLKRVPEQLAANQLRVVEGQPFSAKTVDDDIRRLYRLGEFGSVVVSVNLQPDGSVAVVYTVEEAPIVVDVQAVGNQQVSDQQVAAVVNIAGGQPVDEFALSRAVRAIQELYRSKGYYLADVVVDQEELKNGIVLFRIREGIRLRVTSIRFEGRRSIPRKQLRRQIKTKVAGLLRRGPLIEETLTSDVAAIVRLYRNRGYLDTRADRRVTISPDGKEAIVTFLIEEGPLYTFHSVRLVNARSSASRNNAPPTDPSVSEGLIFRAEQVIGLMAMKPGATYGARKASEAVRDLTEAYWKLGYADVNITSREFRAVDSPDVDLVLVIDEGKRFRTGEVVVQGNSITKQNVVRRQVQVLPDTPLDPGALADTRRRIANTRLFDVQRNPPRVTIQPEDLASPGYRDVLVEVTETNTGNISFGAGVSSDAGLLGSIQLSQNNFDITDTPESAEELLSGRAFRGGGQTFNISASPGTQVQNFSISLSDPRVFETDYSVSMAAFFRNRFFSDHDEKRAGARASVGRRFGDRWTANIALRAERVSLSNIDNDAPVDLFEAVGPDTLFGVGLNLTRTTVPPAQRFRPQTGARTELGIEQIFGDFNFSKIRAEQQFFLPLYEDSQGRAGIFSFLTTVNYIPQQNQAPIYERFFLGGQTFRGFDFRGVSPRGKRHDTGGVSNDPAGGDFSFFAGVEYEHPVFGQVPGTGDPIISVVGFIDTGTVTSSPGFDDYRISVGMGMRMRVPALGPVPLAFDFGFPIKDVAGDDKQVFSFSVDLPF